MTGSETAHDDVMMSWVLALVTTHTVRHLTATWPLSSPHSPSSSGSPGTNQRTESATLDQSEASSAEVVGWYQTESDLANNSRTQTSLAGQNCNHWAEVSALPGVLQLGLSSQLLLDRVWMRWECWPVCTSCHGTRDTILSVARVERLVFGAIFWLIMFDHAKSRVMIPAKPGLIDTIASAPLRAQTVSD